MSVATLKCPSCGTEQMVDPDRRGPDWFCANPGCDFPLFWAPKPPEWNAATEETDAASLRRRPGAEGRATLASKQCPHDDCKEINDFAAELCWRCERPMLKAEVIVQEVVVEPIFIEAPEPEPIPEPKTNWWPWIIGFVLGMIAITTIILLIVY
jgi:hypothetical protein